MAAAARRPAPIYMFNRYADMRQLTGEPAGEGWAKMECDSKNAYGCGENIQEAVQGLALYVRLGEDPLITSSLAIRMTDEALRRFYEELEPKILPPQPEWFQPPKPSQRETATWAQILMHAEDLSMISLCFERPYYHKLVYSLVYDHKRASLSIIKPVQLPALVLQAVPRRTCNGDYELFSLAFGPVDEFSFAPLNTDKPKPFLCVFSPAAASAFSSWEIRRRVGWSVPVSVHKRFRTNLTISFQGKGFWVDLSQGLVYCDLLDISADGDSVVDFSYCSLPHECVLDLEKLLDLEEAMEATRTMGCDRDNIWFVLVDRVDNLVSMWTLKLQGGKPGQWKNEAKFSFSFRDLWRFDGFKEAGLPKARLGYPLFNAVDGVLYLVLLCGERVGTDAGTCWVNHMCSFDVRNKKLLWHGIVHNLPAKPAAIPSCLLPSLLQPVVPSTTTLKKQKRIISLEA